MPNILDNFLEIKKLDSKNMLGSLELLPEQVAEVMTGAEKIKVPAAYKKIKNVAVVGMGGSALGTHLIKAVYADELRVGVEIVNDYRLPAFVDKDTLVILSSYSGTTEEVLVAGAEAKKRKAKIAVIAGGGELAQWARANKYPALIFTANNNPCGSPRMGLGYSIAGQLFLFAKLRLLKFTAVEALALIEVLKRAEERLGVKNPTALNLAKQAAEKFVGGTVWFAAARHLSGNAHIAANQLNENAKRFGGYFLAPELNHHLMEGLLYPLNNKDNLLFVLLESDLYDGKIAKRLVVTKEILAKNGIKFLSYRPQEKDRLAQALEILLWGSFASFYSAILTGIDPTAIPFVDYFKAQLKK